MSATVEQLNEAIRRTREARERVLHRSVDTIIHALTHAAGNWLPPDSPWRRRAVEQAPASTGFSPQMVNEAVDLTFGAITGEALREMLDGELGDRRVLDGLATPHLDPWSPLAPPAAGKPLPQGERKKLRASIVHGSSLIAGSPSCSPRPAGGEAGIASASTGEGGTCRATGPRLIMHFLAGNVPAPGINSICFGLLLKSANIVKLSARDPVFPALFVESLREVDAGLADCVAVLDWRREELALTQAAVTEADAVIAYGDDETIAVLKAMITNDPHPSFGHPLPRYHPGERDGLRGQETTRQKVFLGYGHKLSFAVIGKEAMTADNLPSLAEAAAFDASVYDQQGCLSPHVFYIEEGGELSPRAFAEALAEAMAAYAERVPRGQLSIEEAAQIAKLRGAYEFRAAADKSIAVWAGPAGWLVIYEEDAMFTPSCLNRVVFVKPVEQLKRVPELVRRFVPHLSTVGITPMNERANTFAAELARLGVNRVCPIGQMQRPPLWWYHDGRPNIADLVSWMDAG